MVDTLMGGGGITISQGSFLLGRIVPLCSAECGSGEQADYAGAAMAGVGSGGVNKRTLSEGRQWHGQQSATSDG